MHARLEAVKKQFVFNMRFRMIDPDISDYEVVFAGMVGDQIRTDLHWHFEILNGGMVTLSGPEQLSSGLHKTIHEHTLHPMGEAPRELLRETWRWSWAESIVLGSKPGLYTYEFSHPYYQLKPEYLGENTFEWMEFPNPGVLPSTEFPADDEVAFPQSMHEIFVHAESKNRSNVVVEFMRADGTRASTSPLFIRFSDIAARR